MRKYDIPYVPNAPAHLYPAKPLEEMTLEEIVKKHIKTCGKANGNLAVCSQCKSPCREGKRAIQLLANKVYNDPPVPLYGGKTLIERAREENMKRRENMEKDNNVSSLAKALEEAHRSEEKKDEKKNRNYIKWDGWWETSLESGDQVKWVMENMKLSKTQAKKKIYQYKWAHGMTGNTEEKEEPVTPVVEEPKVEESVVQMDTTIESKLEKLMAKQEEQRKKMDEYMALYQKAKEEYERIKQKTDILASAMDILND